MTIDEAIVRVKKLSPKEGDTILVRFDSSASAVLIGDIRRLLYDALPKSTQVIFLRDGFTIETLSEAKMEELGWIRKPKSENDTNE